MSHGAPQVWLLLLHQIPPNPPYFRAKVLRRLNQLGALAIKNAANVLPETDETVEDIHWVRSEIEQQAAEPRLTPTELLPGTSSYSLRYSFRQQPGSQTKLRLVSG